MSPSAPAAGVYGRPWCRDGISIQNLTLQHPPSFANDAWGRPKEQPCLISVALSFRSSFTSAASKDALDESTMHYGVLGKRLRGTELHSDSQTIDGLADALHETILATPPGVSLLESSQVQIHLPKASLLGQGITFTRFVPYDQVGSTQAKRSLHLRNINVPVLIGVNAHERTRKQPLIVSVWLDGLPDGNAEIYPVLERDLVDALESTSFETLESLAVHTIRLLHEGPCLKATSYYSIRLRFEKPQAIVFADAPAIEIFRTAADMARELDSGSNTPKSTGLRIVKPYVS